MVKFECITKNSNITMTDNKWTSFKVTGDYNTDIRSLYEAWAKPAGLESWFLRKANFYTIPMRDKGPGRIYYERGHLRMVLVWL